ncbi:hypothetical protein D9615_000526 [Tricholomella constricta]|uniref:Uncharacterized protein n=1 Tax=Tricholomella constricta TaxID=117010 RepID=A0A8H5HRL6_9AGAR|nr:hypothetical protein D9615_000526 [Tricholomella constricta]
MSISYQLPTSPTMIPATDGSLQSTLTLLDSLVYFYEQERAWIHRTRTALDDAYKLSQLEPTQSLPSPPPTDSDSSNNSDVSDNNDPSPASAAQAASQSSKRKKGFKLRLNSCDNRIASPKPIRRIASHSDFTQRKQILDMLDRAMEARMESCQRVNRLVRDANRADLHYR